MATKAREVGASGRVDALMPRIARLREQYFDYRPTVCLERALVSTAVFRETEGEPVVIRRAKALRRYCETKTILIQADELIIGNAGCEPRRAVICPELSNYWLDKELDTLATRKQDPYQMSEEQKKTFRRDIYPYWKGKTVIEHWLAQVPADTLQLSNKTGILDCEIKTECGPGEIAIGYADVLLPKGYGGIRADAERRWVSSMRPIPPTSSASTSSKPSSSSARRWRSWRSATRRPLASWLLKPLSQSGGRSWRRSPRSATGSPLSRRALSMSACS